MQGEDFFVRLRCDSDDAPRTPEFDAVVFSWPSRDLPVDPKETCERYPRAC